MEGYYDMYPSTIRQFMSDGKNMCVVLGTVDLAIEESLCIIGKEREVFIASC